MRIRQRIPSWGGLRCRDTGLRSYRLLLSLGNERVLLLLPVEEGNCILVILHGKTSLKIIQSLEGEAEAMFVR